MFFGRDRPEEIKLSDLYKLLESSFEGRLGSLGSKAVSIIKDLERETKNFGSACDYLEKHDAEPHTGNIYFQDTASLKEQKIAYTRAVKRILKGLSLTPDKDLNTYSRYKGMLSNVDIFINDILKTNANFKPVMFCFGNGLKGMRNTFSEIEKSRDKLRREIESRTDEAHGYDTLIERLDTLSMQDEEMRLMRQSITDLKIRLQGSDSNEDRLNIEKLETELKDKRTEVAKAKKVVAEASVKINILCAPLDRASKKFDHGSLRKRRLHDFIDNPVEAIATKSDYDTFLALLNELYDSVESGFVEVRSKSETKSQISGLVNLNIHEKINLLKTDKDKIVSLERELSLIEKTLSDMYSSKIERGDIEKDIEKTERNLEETVRAHALNKKAIEEMFAKNYKKQISIIT